VLERVTDRGKADIITGSRSSVKPAYIRRKPVPVIAVFLMSL